MNDSSATPLPSDSTAASPEGSPAPDDPSERADEPPSHLQIDHHDGLGQRCLKSLAAFEPGDVLSEFAPRRHSDTASRMTVQISEHHHVELGPVYLELINRKVPAELHMYATGGHGFGMRPRPGATGPTDWPSRALDWLKLRGLAVAP